MRKRLLMASLLAVIAIFPVSVMAIGQMTQPIVIKDALRGNSYQEKLTLLNSARNELVFDLEAEGQIAAWTVFYKTTDKAFAEPITKISVPSDNYTDAIAKFSIPKNTPNGEYTGLINVIYTPPASVSSAASTNLAQSVNRKVTIIVSDKEIINYNISVIPEKYDIAPDEAMKVRIIYDNLSNIDIAPQIDLKVKKDNDTVYSAIFPYPEGEKAVTSGSQLEIPSLTIPTNGWQTGSYNATMKFTQSKSEVEKTFAFTIRIPEAAVPAIADKDYGSWPLAITALAVIAAAYFASRYFFMARYGKNNTQPKA